MGPHFTVGGYPLAKEEEIASTLNMEELLDYDIIYILASAKERVRLEELILEAWRAQTSCSEATRFPVALVDPRDQGRI